MKRYLCISLAIISTCFVSGQKQNDSTEWIVPLITQKSDLEKKTKVIDIGEGFTTYEFGGELIKVTYAGSECISHGWKVGPGTVLSYERFPKGKVKFNINDFPADRYIRNAEHTAEYYTDLESGVQYVIPMQPEKNISSIRYAPRKKDSSLRCPGFPAYDLASEVYAPYQKYEIKGDLENDVAQLGPFLIDLKQRANLNGTIFIYGGRNDNKKKTAVLKAAVEKYAFEIEKVSKDRLRVIYGGIRDGGEMEAFLVSREFHPPAPRPKYPSR